MLLMVCSACAFTACSDNDDEPTPPVAPTATMPETFTGEEVTVNGKDFVTAAKLILKNSADATKTLDIEGAAFTATSVTFTVPADAEAGN